MSRVKANVRLDNLHPAMAIADAEVNRLWAQFDLVPMITSGNDSTHRVGSHHYDGEALDYRIRDIPPELIDTIFRILRRNLKPYFRVLLEDDHIHIEVQH